MKEYLYNIGIRTVTNGIVFTFVIGLYLAFFYYIIYLIFNYKKGDKFYGDARVICLLTNQNIAIVEIISIPANNERYKIYYDDSDKLSIDSGYIQIKYVIGRYTKQIIESKIKLVK